MPGNTTPASSSESPVFFKNAAIPWATSPRGETSKTPVSNMRVIGAASSGSRFFTMTEASFIDSAAHLLALPFCCPNTASTRAAVGASGAPFKTEVRNIASEPVLNIRRILAAASPPPVNALIAPFKFSEPWAARPDNGTVPRRPPTPTLYLKSSVMPILARSSAV